jgi:hypothetical protein
MRGRASLRKKSLSFFKRNAFYTKIRKGVRFFRAKEKNDRPFFLKENGKEIL